MVQLTRLGRLLEPFFENYNYGDYGKEEEEEKEV